MNAERMWDRLASRWDTPGVNLGLNDTRLIERAKKYLDTGSVVLDYGCATGSIAKEIAKGVKRVQGIDFSSRMIDIANKKADEYKIKNVDFTHSTIFDKKLQKGSFDVVMAFSVLHLVEDLPHVLSQINSVLKPGGFLISATPCVGEKTFFGLVVSVPVFLLSKIGFLPHVNFISVSMLADLITEERFQVIESVSLSVLPVTEVFIVARKVL
jgi:2-polyprenyl-3-methyl-5-hydroxy-6-metoxy-1,4-benzoquinol methylase